MITVKLHELRRALDVTSRIIRNSAKELDSTPVLKHIHLYRTRSALILESTDRYALIRARCSVIDADTKGFRESFVTPTAATKMLSMLNEAPDFKASLKDGVQIDTGTKDRISFSVGGFPVTIPSAYIKKQWPKQESLTSVLQPQVSTIEGDDALNLKPDVLASILQVGKYRDGHLTITRPKPSGKGRVVSSTPIHFQYGDWASGAIMPMREEAPQPHAWAIEEPTA